MIRKNVGGFNSNIVHSTLKALTFIGDFDSAMVKSVEDELIYKIMNRYEAENNQRQQPTPLYEVKHATTNGMVREFVCTLVDEVSTGVEIAAATENVLGSFKVRACLRMPADTGCRDGLMCELSWRCLGHRVTRQFRRLDFALTSVQA